MSVDGRSTFGEAPQQPTNTEVAALVLKPGDSPARTSDDSDMHAVKAQRVCVATNGNSLQCINMDDDGS